jgi:hypothetical protein
VPHNHLKKQNGKEEAIIWPIIWEINLAFRFLFVVQHSVHKYVLLFPRKNTSFLIPNTNLTIHVAALSVTK